MTYLDALDFILGRTDWERRSISRASFQHEVDLSVMQALVEELEYPEAERLTVHIAGSKGKGSTAAIAASCLWAAGIHAGRYTSPHLLDFRERIVVDAEPIPEAAVVERLGQLRPAIERVDARLAPRSVSTFEIITALAFDWFRHSSCRAQVIETGLGGRLDATNVVTPNVVALTSISYEHTEILGETLAEIAGEKAGIIKPGVPIVSAPQPQEVLDVFERVAYDRGARLLLVGRDIMIEGARPADGGQAFRCRTPRASYDVVLPLLGSHQAENAAVAIGALEQLAASGLPLSSEAIERGLSAVDWPGRLQIARREPWIVLDGAHNGDSARRLREAVDASLPHDRTTIVLGVSRDKHVAAMLAELAPLEPAIVATAARHPRALPPEELLDAVVAAGLAGTSAPDVASALAAAQARSGRNDLVIVTGSLFVVAEALAALAPATRLSSD